MAQRILGLLNPITRHSHSCDKPFLTLYTTADIIVNLIDLNNEIVKIRHPPCFHFGFLFSFRFLHCLWNAVEEVVLVISSFQLSQ